MTPSGDRVLTRGELVRDQLTQPPFGTRRPRDATPVRVGVTGTGDDLLVLAWSAAGLARERAAGTRVLRRLGVEPGMRVANVLPGALATPGSLLLGDVIEELGALDVPLGIVDGESAARQAWDLVDRVEPHVLVLDHASGPALLAAIPAGARPWWRGIVWLGIGSAAPAPAAFDGWQRNWLAVPEATSFLGASCTASRVHVDEAVAVEVAAPDGTPIPRGDAGMLLVTVRDPDLPLARYASGLRARIAPTPCPCGLPGVTVELLR